MRRGRPVVIVEVARGRPTAMWRGRRPVVVEVVARRRPEALAGRRGPVVVLAGRRGRSPIVIWLRRSPGRREDEQGGAGEECSHVVSVRRTHRGHAST